MPRDLSCGYENPNEGLRVSTPSIGKKAVKFLFYPEKKIMADRLPGLKPKGCDIDIHELKLVATQNSWQLKTRGSKFLFVINSLINYFYIYQFLYPKNFLPTVFHVDPVFLY